MRLEFNKTNLMMTSAVSAGKMTIDAAYDVEAMVRNLDFIHLMSYDLHGTWEQYAHHHSPLYAHELDKGDNTFLNVDWAVKYWLKMGVPASKLVMGIGLYGRCFTLASAAQHKVYSPAPQPGIPGPYTREPGVLGYNEICEQEAHNLEVTMEEEEKEEIGNNIYQNEQGNKELEENSDDVGRVTNNIGERMKRSLYLIQVWNENSQNNSRMESVGTPPASKNYSDVFEYVDDNEEGGAIDENYIVKTLYRNKRILENKVGIHRKSGFAGNNGNTWEYDHGSARYDQTENVKMTGNKAYESIKTNSKNENEKQGEKYKYAIKGDTPENAINRENEGWTIVRDKNMISPYAYRERQWCGYDDIQSATIKAEYIIKLGLAGAMVWSIDTDDFHGKCNGTQTFPLITTIRTILRDGKPIPTLPPTTTSVTTVNPNTTSTSVTTTTSVPPSTPPPSAICHREGLNADPEGDCTIFYNCHAVSLNESGLYQKVYIFTEVFPTTD
ncbi:Endochitinase 1 [Halocaridina rubra]|uniref:Endochitinase 1 n=1 Tax=Halocaridina rubra TaxID=373956 RepID=A0AAN9A8K8_HALRR